MTLTLHIPTWLLWLIGVPLVVIILLFASLGVWLALEWMSWSW